MDIKLIEARYVGRCKDRPDGTQTAYIWSNGAWSVSVLKSALYTYFGVPMRPGEEPTLYGALGIDQSATTEEIKKAYRRMAKQWHPDVSKEPGTREQFAAIQHAYEVLSTKRSKYDAGLALQASLAKNTEAFAAATAENKFGYRSPLRCGWILGKGETQRGRFQIAEILGWEDITNNRGQTLVASWIYGEDAPREEWS
jgi:DnaJ-domain-containing protein 1